MRQPQNPSSWRTAVVLVAGGLAFGTLNALANRGAGPDYLAKLVGNDWGWLVAGLIACRPARSWGTALARGLGFFLPAVVAYYVNDALAGVYDSVDRWDPLGPKHFSFPEMLSDVIAYTVISTLTAAALALIVVLSRRGGVLGLLASIVVPGYIAWHAWETHSYLSRDHTDPTLLRLTAVLWPASLIVTVALVVARARPLWSRTT